ncbi:UDP-N-acetylglucosamine 2-epimerase (non-hydrolyzing) [Candidatus Micrarchaeota archaeon]|nr:UDP-N-acetylglucosamine 2-epimerase (non-hydrolyzing) [Candidatus Micrarchaeota archaeon]
MKIVSVVGARPNFMKMASLDAAFRKSGKVQNVLVHTGQHYDDAMSQVFFDELQLPKPDQYLGVGSGSHAQQTAEVMKRFEPVMDLEKPDAVLVVGDVNSTLACALAAAKKQVPVAHVEAGLRSFDKNMPEEVNRLVTDHLSTWLFTSEPSGAKNLEKEGITDDVFFAGNTMIDTLRFFHKKARDLNMKEKLDLEGYGLVTLHRPENVDDSKTLAKIVALLEVASRHEELVWPVHPRTKKQLEHTGLNQRIADNKKIRLLEPQGYLEFLSLQMDARFVLTDSGGIQEETTFLDVPCLTLRENTERPVTVEQGSNTLVGSDKGKLRAALEQIGRGTYKHATVPENWDGKAGQRIAEYLEATE